MVLMEVKAKSKRLAQSVARNIPGYLSGRKKDRHQIAKVFWGVFIAELFSQIQLGYAVKAEGGSDSLGNSWKPLSPSTIAKRKERGYIKRSLNKLRGNSSRGILTAQENLAWKAMYSRLMFQLVGHTNQQHAEKIAAAAAWKYVKKMGAQTIKKKKLSSNNKIMRDTDRIYKSLKPAKPNRQNGYRPRKDQIASFKNGVVVIGTKVPYAKFHNKTRPVIPDNIDEWVDIALRKATKALKERVAEVLR
jgi:hypothetical protein